MSKTYIEFLDLFRDYKLFDKAKIHQHVMLCRLLERGADLVTVSSHIANYTSSKFSNYDLMYNLLLEDLELGYSN